MANIVPSSNNFIINYRYAANKTKKQAEKELSKIILPNVDKLTIIENAPAAKPVHNNPILDSVKKHFSLNTLPKQAWTDIARLGEAGIFAVNLGPGNPNEAHQKNEKISLAALNKGLIIYKKIICDKI